MSRSKFTATLGVLLVGSIGGCATAQEDQTDVAPPEKCLVLMVNDDGIDSANFKDLARHLGPLVELVISAPSTNYSGMSSALGDWRDPMAVTEPGDMGGSHAFAIAASPVIAARFGIWKVKELYGRKPDLVLSGPNDGLNQGNAARYSGTIGAAREGAGIGVWGLAISVDRDREPGLSEAALSLSANMTKALCASSATPMLLNFNLPADPGIDLADIKIAPPAMNVVQIGFQMQEDGTAKAGFAWADEVATGTDVSWLRQGKAVITVLPMEEQSLGRQEKSLNNILARN